MQMTLKNEFKHEPTIARTLHRNPRLNGFFDIILRANGVEVTEELREAVTKKIGRARQYAPRAFRARVHVERDHLKAAIDQYRVMVRYEIPGHDVIAEHRAHEPMTALDLVAEKIERRLRKRKTARLAKRLGRDARARRIADFRGTNENNFMERSH
jgi:ribosomal subunit interface protein